MYAIDFGTRDDIQDTELSHHAQHRVECQYMLKIEFPLLSTFSTDHSAYIQTSEPIAMSPTQAPDTNLWPPGTVRIEQDGGKSPLRSFSKSLLPRRRPLTRTITVNGKHIILQPVPSSDPNDPLVSLP